MIESKVVIMTKDNFKEIQDNLCSLQISVDSLSKCPVKEVEFYVTRISKHIGRMIKDIYAFTIDKEINND